jgi:hypothetical protein
MKRLIAVLAVAAGLMVPILLIPSGAGAAPPNGGGYCGASANGWRQPLSSVQQRWVRSVWRVGNYGDVTHDFGVNKPKVERCLGPTVTRPASTTARCAATVKGTSSSCPFGVNGPADRRVVFSCPWTYWPR